MKTAPTDRKHKQGHVIKLLLSSYTLFIDIMKSYELYL